MIQDYK